MQRWALHSLIYARHVFAQLVLLAPVVAVMVSPSTYAIPQVEQRFDRIADSTPLAVTTHQLGFAYTDFANPVGSVSFEFCSNSPIPQVACVAPAGFDASAAVLASQSGQAGFAISPADSTANKLVISRSASAPTAPAATSRYTFNNVTNPSSGGSHYARIQTYTSQDATGPALEEGGVVFVILDAFSVSSEVPPYLEFCAAVTISGFNCTSATSFLIDLGELSKTSPKVASSELVGATNAGLGYSVTLAGTTLTSGNNVIPALNAQTASNPGTSQFGLNLRANNNLGIGANPTGPGTAMPAADYFVANRFKFVPGDAIITTATTSDFRKFTVSYLTNVHTNQAAGVYATTVSFIALANF